MKETISILIVDDEQYVCDSVRLKIERLKHPVRYRIVGCPSGSGALKRMESEHFDALITDIRMPFMTGISLIKAARANGFSGKIFVLSGYDDFTYVRDAFTSGADDYLLKPVSAAELEQKFRQFLLPGVEGRPDAPKPDSANPQRGIIPCALAYMQTHYMNSTLRMEEVAKHVSVSYSHFSSLFRRETGTTFPAYLRKLRVEKAIEYLSDPDMRIAEVCYRVGFKYPQQFSNDFKKVTGVYPSEYFSEKGKAQASGEESD